MTHTILIVDDEATQRNILQHVITEKLGYRGIIASSGAEAISWIQKCKKPAPDLMLLDYELGSNNALDVMQSLRENGIDIPVVVVTAYGDMEKASACIRAGAFDFLSKPINIERLDVSLRNALHAKRLQMQVQRLEKHRTGGASFSDMVGGNVQFTNCVGQATKIAHLNTPVLLEGENGVGKETFARAIHGASARSRFPFVVIDCGAVSEQSSDHSALYKKLLEANQGTAYLVGICNLELERQAKLLRALQEGEIVASGTITPTKLDVRLISSTNRNLDMMVQRGEFRSDLQHRLSSAHILLPALRDRRDDIHMLIEHFIRKYAALEYKTIRGITPSALGMLVSHSWHGNIRHLENLVFRAVVMTERSQLDIDDFEPLRKAQTISRAQMIGGSDMIGHNQEISAMQALSSIANESSSLMSLVAASGHMKRMDQLEVEAIRYALHYYKGHMSEVARRLGIGRSTLYRKMHDFNIVHPEAVSG